jgi:hypothetical protein
MTDATTAPAPLSSEAITATLNAEVARLASKGWTVNSVAGSQAVLQRKKRIGVFWNLLLAILTGGLWLIVVIVRLVNRKIETRVLTVDAFGKVAIR